MVRRYLLTLAFAVRLAGGQVPGDPAFDEAAFRKAVHEGLNNPNSAVLFAISHEDVAVPILVAEIKSRLNDPQADYLVHSLADLAVYNGDERALDAAADFYQTDQKRFSWTVSHVMNRALGRERAYELARYAVERYPNLREPVVGLVVAVLKISPNDGRLAREMLKSEKPGKPIDASDPLLSRLPAAARDQIKRAVEKERTQERQQKQ